MYFNEFNETEKMVLKSVVPGAYLVDMIPKLCYLPSWIPFNSIHRVAEKGRKQVLDVVYSPMERVKEGVEHGGDEGQAMIKQLPWVAWSMFEAGNDTVAGTMLVFMHAMAYFPEVQDRMREEIYRVVGADRLPPFNDHERLPYINAAIKEVYRWNPNSPMGAPRKLQDADIYKGYYIPKRYDHYGQCLLISRDRDSGIDPEVFAPERFLKSHVMKTAVDPYSYSFSFGRRMCPGRFLADNTVFILITGLLTAVQISKPRDGDAVQPRYIPVGLVG